MTHRRLQNWMVALLAATASATSVAGSPPLAEQRAAYEANAGQPVDDFTWLQRYYSWVYLGRVENHYEIAVWTTPFDAYLLKVGRPCEDLPFDSSIRFTSTSKTISRRYDFVVVRSERGNPAWRCPIQEIRPVDGRAVVQDPRVRALAKNGS